MPETKRKKANGKWTSAIPVSAYIFAALFVAGALGVWMYLRTPASPPAAPVLTPEAKAYVRNLQLSEVGMQAQESYLKQRVVEITGKIGNTGDRRLQLVEITCVFYDPYAQIVLRERVPIVSAKAGGLNPGETKSFRLAFDNLPESWNQSMPQLVIAQIQFAE